MLVILICANNLPAIAVLNGGIVPEIEERATYFVFDPDGPNRIITQDQTDEYVVRKILTPLHTCLIVDPR